MIKAGNLVRAGYQGGPVNYTGIVTQLEETTNSLSGVETVIHVLCDGQLKFFSLEEDNIEVINESSPNS